MKEFIAHINNESGNEQSVIDHLTGTAQLAKVFAKEFGAEEAAGRCAMLHDIGKYTDAFLRRIHGGKERPDHSTAGAQVAYKEYKDYASSFSIAGHHGGIPDFGSRTDTPDRGTLLGRLKRSKGKEIDDYDYYISEVGKLSGFIPKQLTSSFNSMYFYTKMLFSCLTDADYIDTERFMQPSRTRCETYAKLDELLDKLNCYIKPWLDATCKTTAASGETCERRLELNILRNRILTAAIQSGKYDKGLFTMTVPTGGGKTISSIAFGLIHANTHKELRRIIYVIPYTSIIEQTQAVFEKIFGKENVVAHFSNAIYNTGSAENDARYLSTENWDAPIIITTNVQFFESLYANKPSKCRKLHSIANSVLIFDEAQMLPVNYLAPCVRAITELVKNYGCSAVLCTATQPSIEKLIKTELPDAVIRELCPKPEQMYQKFTRVRYEYLGELADETLFNRLTSEKQALCILNNRKQAQELFGLFSNKTGVFHLSTTMFPAHRRSVLAEIRRRLATSEKCIVFSTSLIEAGVDVDFPTVYRAMAGLDSIVQAGGRCNRENKRKADESTVYCFKTQRRAPASMSQNIAAAESVMVKHRDIASQSAIRDYFELLLYTLKDKSSLDTKRILTDIDSGKFNFEEIANRMKLIETDERTVYIPKGDGAELTRQLISIGPSRALMRSLGQYAVSVYPEQYKKLVNAGAVQPVSENSGILINETLYSVDTGLALSDCELNGQCVFV